MSYDVVFTETTGEVSVETKFKNYKDYIDYTERKDGVECSSIKLETTSEVKLTTLNIVGLVTRGDTVILKDAGNENKHYFELNTEYLVSNVDFNDKVLPISLVNPSQEDWVDFTDTLLEIYKVIK